MKMKNKKLDQAAEKKQRLEALKAKRRKGPSLERVEQSLVEKPTILIVCEGENTEPSYFKQFRLTSATIIPIGEGYNTVSLVSRALVLSKVKQYDQVWCVFDKDDFSEVDFNNAITLAESNDFGIAYSNQAFEYWLILHFDDHQGGGMNRTGYDEKINKLLKPFKIEYDGKRRKVITKEFFELLDGVDFKTKKERKILAIERAKRNLSLLNQGNPAKEESSTTVFKLVEELIKYL